MNKPSMTAVVIAKNEALMIEACLETLQWCTEVLVIDNGSTDATADLAEKRGARVISFKHQSFARLRTEALKAVATDWLLYIDADERVTPELAKEIMVRVETGNWAALAFLRQNYFFGQLFRHGGWETDTVIRAFKTEDLKEWRGDVHESPVFDGQSTLLTFPLVHFTHRSVAAGLSKSAEWTPIEASLLFQSATFQVGVGTIIKKGLAEFVKRAIYRQGYQDGQAGWVESISQAINRMLVYMQVWELQQNPSSAKKYEQLEKKIKEKWQSA